MSKSMRHLAPRMGTTVNFCCSRSFAPDGIHSFYHGARGASSSRSWASRAYQTRWLQTRWLVPRGA